MSSKNVYYEFLSDKSKHSPTSKDKFIKTNIIYAFNKLSSEYGVFMGYIVNKNTGEKIGYVFNPCKRGKNNYRVWVISENMGWNGLTNVK